MCVFVVLLLFSINSEELFEVAVTDFFAPIAVTHYVLAHPLVDLWHVYIVSHAAAIPAATSASVSTGDSLGSPQFRVSRWPSDGPAPLPVPKCCVQMISPSMLK